MFSRRKSYRPGFTLLMTMQNINTASFKSKSYHFIWGAYSSKCLHTASCNFPLVCWSLRDWFGKSETVLDGLRCCKKLVITTSRRATVDRIQVPNLVMHSEMFLHRTEHIMQVRTKHENIETASRASNMSLPSRVANSHHSFIISFKLPTRSECRDFSRSSKRVQYS